MKQYLELLEEVLDKGVWKAPARENMPRTKSRFSVEKRFDMADGFPLLTTKKMHYKGILHELIWFLRGDTNIKYLVDNGVKIWNDDAYRWYLQKCGEAGIGVPMTQDEFVRSIKAGDFTTGLTGYELGDMGKLYGYHWRNFSDSDPDSNGVDQISKLIEGIKNEPYSRYHVVSAWNPAEENYEQKALPSCHMLFQLNCRRITPRRRTELAPSYIVWPEGLKSTREWDAECDKLGLPKFYLDLKVTQRSCDSMLGVPYNIASYGFLLHIISRFVNMVPGELIWSGNDVHIYENHLDQVKLQLSRKPKSLPELRIASEHWRKIEDVRHENFELIGYDPHPAIKAELSTGLKK